MSELEFTVELENLEEVKEVFERFPKEVTFSIYDSLMRTANREEKILKATGGFRDRTGHLRRSLFVTAVLEPLGLEAGAFAQYAPYVAFPHGTWLGGFWDEYINGAIPRILDDVEQALINVAKKFSGVEGEE